MKIGIVSDSHDHLPLLRKAVDYFNQQKVEYVIHGGDYVAPFAARILNDLQMPWIGIFGNNDGEKEGLRKMSEGRIHEDPHEMELSGKKILITHYLENENLVNEYDLIISGHTHNSQIKKAGRALLVNPGECCGYLTGKASVALVDLQLGQGELVELGQ